MDAILELGVANVGWGSRWIQRAVPSTNNSVALIVASSDIGIITIISSLAPYSKSISTDGIANTCCHGCITGALPANFGNAVGVTTVSIDSTTVFAVFVSGDKSVTTLFYSSVLLSS